MYGPPPTHASFPALGPRRSAIAWAVTLAVGALLLAGWRARPRRAQRAASSGLTVVLTAPALGLLDAGVWGAFPTIDKEGSLLFYLDGVHQRARAPLDAAGDPASRLIGVHTGTL